MQTNIWSLQKYHQIYDWPNVCLRRTLEQDHIKHYIIINISKYFTPGISLRPAQLVKLSQKTTPIERPVMAFFWSSVTNPLHSILHLYSLISIFTLSSSWCSANEAGVVALGWSSTRRIYNSNTYQDDYHLNIIKLFPFPKGVFWCRFALIG